MAYPAIPEKAPRPGAKNLFTDSYFSSYHLLTGYGQIDIITNRHQLTLRGNDAALFEARYAAAIESGIPYAADALVIKTLQNHYKREN